MNSLVLSKNEKKIMRIVRSQPEIMRSDIPKHTDLTQQSIHRLITQLIEKKLLVEHAPIIKGRGKPSPRMNLNQDETTSIGISIRTDRVEMIAIDITGKTLCFTILETPPNQVEPVLRQCKQIMAGWKQQRLQNRLILGVGIAVQGFRTTALDCYIKPEPLGHWSQKPINALFAAQLQLDCFSDNNANCSVYAEHHMNPNPNIHSISYLSFNYGFGSGSIHQHRLIQGGFGNAGEISHLFTPEEMKHRPALGELIKRLREHGVVMQDTSQLCAEFNPDWPGLQEWLDEISPYLNRAILGLSALLDPQVIVFGGEAPSKLRQLFIQQCNHQNPHNNHFPLALLQESVIEGDAATLGAALLPIRKIVF